MEFKQIISPYSRLLQPSAISKYFHNKWSHALQKKSLDTLVKHLQKVSDLKIFNCFSKANTFGALHHIDQLKGLNEFFIYTSAADGKQELGAKTKGGELFEFHLKQLMQTSEFNELKTYIIKNQ